MNNKEYLVYRDKLTLIVYQDAEEDWTAFCLENDSYESTAGSKAIAIQELVNQIKNDLMNDNMFFDTNINSSQTFATHSERLSTCGNFEAIVWFAESIERERHQ